MFVSAAPPAHAGRHRSHPDSAARETRACRDDVRRSVCRSPFRARSAPGRECCDPPYGGIARTAHGSRRGIVQRQLERARRRAGTDDVPSPELGPDRPGLAASRASKELTDAAPRFAFPVRHPASAPACHSRRVRKLVSDANRRLRSTLDGLPLSRRAPPRNLLGSTRSFSTEPSQAQCTGCRLEGSSRGSGISEPEMRTRRLARKPGSLSMSRLCASRNARIPFAIAREASHAG